MAPTPTAGRRPTPPAGRLDALRQAGRGDRVHVAVRWLTLPVPGGGGPGARRRAGARGRLRPRLLSPLYLAGGARPRRSTASTSTAPRWPWARRAAAAAGLGTWPSAVAPGWRAGRRPWDAIVVVDVLYLLGPRPAVDLAGAAAAAALAPGGVLVVKEIDTRPRWKYRLAVAQELAATRVARVTAGDTVASCRPSRSPAP